MFLIPGLVRTKPINSMFFHKSGRKRRRSHNFVQQKLTNLCIMVEFEHKILGYKICIFGLKIRGICQNKLDSVFLELAKEEEEK